MTKEFFTYAACGSKAISSRSALVTASTDHIGSAATLAPANVTHGADGPLKIAITSWRRKEEHRYEVTEP